MQNCHSPLCPSIFPSPISTVTGKVVCSFWKKKGTCCFWLPCLLKNLRFEDICNSSHSLLLISMSQYCTVPVVYFKTYLLHNLFYLFVARSLYLGRNVFGAVRTEGTGQLYIMLTLGLAKFYFYVPSLLHPIQRYFFWLSICLHKKMSCQNINFSLAFANMTPKRIQISVHRGKLCLTLCDSVIAKGVASSSLPRERSEDGNMLITGEWEGREGEQHLTWPSSLRSSGCCWTKALCTTGHRWLLLRPYSKMT